MLMELNRGNKIYLQNFRIYINKRHNIQKFININRYYVKEKMREQKGLGLASSISLTQSPTRKVVGPWPAFNKP